VVRLEARRLEVGKDEAIKVKYIAAWRTVDQMLPLGGALKEFRKEKRFPLDAPHHAAQRRRWCVLAKFCCNVRK
jgi:hypothetical protein